MVADAFVDTSLSCSTPVAFPAKPRVSLVARTMAFGLSTASTQPRPGRAVRDPGHSHGTSVVIQRTSLKIKAECQTWTRKTHCFNMLQ